MLFLINLFGILLPLIYFATIWAYAKAFFSGVRTAERLKRPLLITLLVVHAAYILLRTVTLHHPPITTMFEILSLIAFTVVLVYTYIEFRTKNTSTGYFILMLPFFFEVISALFIRNSSEVPPMLQSNLLGIHVSSAFLGYAAITISAAYGFLYLMLYHDIKSKQFGVIYKRLPNLETLERMSLTATIFGFILLTVAIIIGIIWLPQVSATFTYADPKLIGTVAIWVIYGASLVAKNAIGFQGRRMMVLSVAGFVVAILSMTIINVFFTEFHKFY